jgi:hypothetical protein
VGVCERFPKAWRPSSQGLAFVSTAFRCAEHPQDNLKTVIHDSLMTVDAQPPADCLARKTTEAVRGNRAASLRAGRPVAVHASSLIRWYQAGRFTGLVSTVNTLRIASHARRLKRYLKRSLKRVGAAAFAATPCRLARRIYRPHDCVRTGSFAPP